MHWIREITKAKLVWTSRQHGQHALGCANGKKEAERIRKGIKNLSGDGEEEGGESRV